MPAVRGYRRPTATPKRVEPLAGSIVDVIGGIVVSVVASILISNLRIIQNETMVHAASNLSSLT